MPKIDTREHKVSSTNGDGKTDVHRQKEDLSLCRKPNSKGTQNLTVKPETMNLLKKTQAVLYMTQVRERTSCRGLICPRIKTNNQQMGLHETKKFLHSLEEANRMGENLTED